MAGLRVISMSPSDADRAEPDDDDRPEKAADATRAVALQQEEADQQPKVSGST